MDALNLVRLTALLERTRGNPQRIVGLIDGPVAIDHPDLAGENIRVLGARQRGSSAAADDVACTHGTFIAGILAARRQGPAPAICPDCTLLVRPIFGEAHATTAGMPLATPSELAAAITECVAAGATVLNISAALSTTSLLVERPLDDALGLAARRGVIVVVAAGNQRSLGGNAIARHPWVVPVASYDAHGRPMDHSNLGWAIGRRGIGAPGDRVTSLGTSPRHTTTLSGTSVAAAFVTGTFALLWSEFRAVTATALKLAVTGPTTRRTSVTPPLLDAWGAYQTLKG